MQYKDEQLTRFSSRDQIDLQRQEPDYITAVVEHTGTKHSFTSALLLSTHYHLHAVHSYLKNQSQVSTVCSFNAATFNVAFLSLTGASMRKGFAA